MLCAVFVLWAATLIPIVTIPTASPTDLCHPHTNKDNIFQSRWENRLRLPSLFANIGDLFLVLWVATLTPRMIIMTATPTDSCNRDTNKNRNIDFQNYNSNDNSNIFCYFHGKKNIRLPTNLGNRCSHWLFFAKFANGFCILWVTTLIKKVQFQR